MTTGIVLVDKPGGMTSHDVVSRARRALGTRKVGHAGTLDPMATGLLLLGVDSSTRLLTYLVGLDKHYTATIRLGEATDTDDAEGEVTARVDASAVPRDAIDAQVARLTGPIEQVPSTYSAIKVDGRRSYDRARAGEAVELAPRSVTINRFEVRAERRDAAVTELDVEVACTSGTYIRALARDLGAGLGVGGHLTALRRTAIGPFDIADAVAIDAITPAAQVAPAVVAARLFPTAELDAAQLTDLTHGKRIELRQGDLPHDDAPVVAAIAPDGRLAGLVRVERGRARVLVNFPTGEVLA